MSRKMLSVGLSLLLGASVAKADPAMWVIRDADSTIYLIGTLHLLKRDAEWNAEKVKKTVHESTELWLETTDDDNAALQLLLIKLGLDPEHPLSTKLNEDQKKKLAELATRYGISPTQLEPLRPWLAGVSLAMSPIQKAGYDPKAGVESVLTTQATAEADKIHGFETAEEQLHLLADLSEEEQLQFFVGTLDDLEKGLELVDQLAKAWIDGDLETIDRLSVADIKAQAPTVYDKLLVRRNKAWAEKIEQMLKGSGVQQIAVGAGHLVGRDSLQVQLAKRGIKVEKY
ncbi:MAG TPA: TraB/GumN family protein [Chthoniobacterales bacterium]|nr:TraB/GumN family protein [Chthoniobacterales bacterium]